MNMLAATTPSIDPSGGWCAFPMPDEYHDPNTTEPVVPSLEVRDATWQMYKQSLRQSSEARRDLLSAEAGARHRLMQGRCREAPGETSNCRDRCSESDVS